MIPANWVDFVKAELEMEIGTHIYRAVSWGPQYAALEEEMRKRIARRWLRGE
jgi:hypothetical protein